MSANPNRRADQQGAAAAQQQQQQQPGHRAALAATAWALAALLAGPVQPVAAEEPSPAAQQEQAAAAAAGPAITPVYFGNGCFWGRQFDYVNAEKALGRDAASMSAVAGYAGGATPAKGGKVCYYRGPSGSVYEELGHAEVVGVNLEGQAADAQAQQQYRKFAETYFKQVGAGAPAGAPSGVVVGPCCSGRVRTQAAADVGWLGVPSSSSNFVPDCPTACLPACLPAHALPWPCPLPLACSSGRLPLA
jgi:hypothetical protein